MTARIRTTLVALVAIGGVAVVVFIDYITGYEVRLFPLYFLPVALVAWRLRHGTTLAICGASALTWVFSNWLAGRVYSNSYVWGINAMSQFTAFATVGLLVVELRARLHLAETLGRTDPLTRLPNRRAFAEGAELLLTVAHRGQRPVTLAYLDLDNFKRVNDERGHHQGDLALQEVAAVLRSQLRASDLIARVGGDEFALLLPDTGPEAALSSLERVRTAVVTAMERNAWPITASVGALCNMQAPASVEQSLRSADAVMYRAKRCGKNRVLVELGDDGPDSESA